MKIFNKTKVTLALFVAVLVAGFAFAETVQVTKTLWSEGKTFDTEEFGQIDLPGTAVKVGDKLIITYEKAGSAFQDNARAAAPMRDISRSAEVRIFVDEANEPLKAWEELTDAGTLEYTFEAAIEATSKITISARNLTITKVELETEEEAGPFDPATAIANPSFELDGEKSVSGAALELTGWTFAGVGTQFNNTEIRPANSASTTSQFGTSAPKAGDYFLFFRQGWNGNGNTITITSDALTEIPSGNYILSVAYKQHYSYDNTTSQNTFVGLSLVNGETTLATGQSPAATGVQGGSGDATYFNDTEWSVLEVPFTLAEATTGAQVVITLNAGGQRRSDFCIDDVKLTEVPAIELALKDLEAAIAAAQAQASTYTIGEGLFYYPASEIEPLTNAIAAAQAAYSAAESKEAVEAATATLNAFLSTFAPAMNVPTAGQAYNVANATADGNLCIADGKVTVAHNATVYFTAVEGGYVISNKDGEYIFKTTDNNWTLATPTTLADAYVLTVVPVEGGYTLKGAKGLLGLDSTTEGSTVYADKNQEKNGLWTIAEATAEEPGDDYTSYIVNADLTNSETKGFDDAGTKGIDGSGVVKVGNAASFDFKQTISLPAGKYKLTAQAAYRYGADEQAEYDAIQAGTSTKLVQLYATVGSKTVAAPIQNRYDGASETNLAGDGAVQVNNLWVPNSTNAVKAWFAAGKYVNEVEFNLPADGDVTIGINRISTPASDYTVIGPWTLTRIGDAETEPEPQPATLAEGKYYMYNVAAEGYLVGANNWGTRASIAKVGGIEIEAVSADGKYELKTPLYNKHLGFDGYVDNGNPANWTVTGVEGQEGVFTLSTDGTNVLFWDGGSATTTSVGAMPEAAANAHWKFIPVADRLASLATATANKSVDATFLISNPNFDREASTAAWENENSSITFGGNNDNRVAESYMKAFDFKQTLANAPAGIYKLSAQASVTFHDNRTIKEYDGNGYPVVFANETTADFIDMEAADQLSNMGQMSTAYSAGRYYIEPIFVQVETDGALTVGAKSERADIWAIFDNFVLTYYGADATIDQVKNADILAELAELKAEAEALVSGVENETVASALQAAIDAAAAATDTESINAAIEALKAAIDNAKALPVVKDVLAAMKNVMEGTNVYTAEALATYKALYDEIEGKYNAGTYTYAEAAALENPESVMGWHQTNVVDDLLLSSWSIGETKANNYDAGLYINTWSTEGNTDGSNFKVPFFEYWVGDGESLGANTISAELLGLEAGEYEVSAWVRVRVKNGAEAPATGISMQVNEGEAVAIAGDQVGTSQMYLQEYTATGVVAEDGVLKIKFDVAAENNVSWLSFKNVKYTKKGGTQPEPVEGILYSWESPEGTPAEYGGTIVYTNGTGDDRVNYPNSGYYTICLNGKKANINDETASANAGHMVITLNEAITEDCAISMDAYIVKDASKKSSAYFIFENGTEFEGAIYSDEANIDPAFNGQITNTVTEIPATAVGSKTIKITRGQTGTNLFITKLVIGKKDVVTGIENVTVTRSDIDGIYNLRGQRVLNPTKGLYIINGKKVIIR